MPTIEQTYDISRRNRAKLEAATETLTLVRASLQRQRKQLEKLTAKHGDTRGLEAKIQSLEASERAALREVLLQQEPCFLAAVISARESWIEALAALRACRNELKVLCR